MYNQSEIGSALTCLRTFKEAYKEENRVISIGDIKDLIDKIDLIEDCIKKQKNIPTNDEKQFGIFGKRKRIKHCRICNAVVDATYGQFCSECGQRFC